MFRVVGRRVNRVCYRVHGVGLGGSCCCWVAPCVGGGVFHTGKCFSSRLVRSGGERRKAFWDGTADDSCFCRPSLLALFCVCCVCSRMCGGAVCPCIAWTARHCTCASRTTANKPPLQHFSSSSLQELVGTCLRTRLAPELQRPTHAAPPPTAFSPLWPPSLFSPCVLCVFDRLPYPTPPHPTIFTTLSVFHFFNRNSQSKKPTDRKAHV